MTPDTVVQRTQAQEQPWQACFFSDEPDGLNAWTTDELLTEVFGRNAHDAPALRSMQARALRALLMTIDD
jgi:hypothetical protein